MINEIWKQIKDFPYYEVSNYGRVKSLKFGKERILKQHPNNKGYFRVGLCKNGVKIDKSIHTLMFESFNDYKLKDNECIHHIDKNSINNNLINFQLMTKENHSKLHNTGKICSNKTKDKLSEQKKGENNPNFGKITSDEIKKKIVKNNHNCKLTEKKIIQIKMLFKLGFKGKEIAKLFNVKSNTISMIKTGKRWSYIKI